MKRRNFIGSMFAAGAIVENPPQIILGKTVLGGGEVSTPADKSFDFKSIEAFKPRTTPTHIKLSPDALAYFNPDDLVERTEAQQWADELDRKILGK